MLGEDVAGIQDQGQTPLSSLPHFLGLDSFFLLTFPSHSITLIVLSSEEGTSELRLERLLQMIFGAMVLLVGLEELTNIRNVERLKKELRVRLLIFGNYNSQQLLGQPDPTGSWGGLVI